MYKLFPFCQIGTKILIFSTQQCLCHI